MMLFRLDLSNTQDGVGGLEVCRQISRQIRYQTFGQFPQHSNLAIIPNKCVFKNGRQYTVN